MKDGYSHAEGELTRGLLIRLHESLDELGECSLQFPSRDLTFADSVDCAPIGADQPFEFAT
jgi:hypothetical protein